MLRRTKNKHKNQEKLNKVQKPPKKQTKQNNLLRNLKYNAAVLKVLKYLKSKEQKLMFN